MCESCNHIQVNGKLQVNAKNYDPTRTTVLRNAFVKDLNKRFTILIKLINKAVIDEDCFGLEKPETITVFAETPGHKAFQFGSSQQKVDAFITWLNGQVDKNMLEVSNINQVGTGINNAWTNKYISDSYKRGVIRARYELQKAGFNSIPGIDATGGINLSMTTPFHIDRLGVLYSRTYTDLKGITNAMDTQISRILSQGIADGDNPRLLAKKIVNEIDGSGTGDLATKGMSAKRRAEILARTEIIRAHHQATIQEYRNWGAEDVHVQAEFTTAGDDRVCEQCKELNGKIYTLDAIQNVIPVHPQCRCIALPTLPDEDLEEETPVPIRTKFKPSSNDLWVYENAIRFNKDFETGVLFDAKTGKKVFMKVGDKTSCSFTTEEVASFKGQVFSHNHPRGASYPVGDVRRIGSSFSISDLELAMNSEMAQMRAVTPEFTFIVEPPLMGWENFKGQFGTYKLRYEYDRAGEEVGEYISRMISKDFISVDAANVIHHHLVNKLVSERLGYTYKKIRMR